MSYLTNIQQSRRSHRNIFAFTLYRRASRNDGQRHVTPNTTHCPHCLSFNQEPHPSTSFALHICRTHEWHGSPYNNISDHPAPTPPAQSSWSAALLDWPPIVTMHKVCTDRRRPPLYNHMFAQSEFKKRNGNMLVICVFVCQTIYSSRREAIDVFCLWHFTVYIVDLWQTIAINVNCSWHWMEIIVGGGVSGRKANISSTQYICWHKIHCH